MPTVSEDRRARLVLSRVGEPGDVRLTSLVADLGPVTVLGELHQRNGAGDLADGLASRLASADPVADLAAARARGIRFVTPEDEEWPAPLDDLVHADPLHDRGGPPVGIWLRGPLRLDEVAAGAVAVVGSRSATTYGTALASELAAGVAASGRAVVSGAAFGIDQAAHRGALAAKGPTLAVLACGADRVYPSAHARLLGYLAEHGLVAAESAPGCSPTRIRFLARNRLIAALSAGTVVVEAALRSGALNTANWASGLSRVLMGVPGPVTSAQSQGVHQLIRRRDGLLVTTPEEVLEAVGEAGEALIPHRSGQERPRDRLSTVQRVVLDAVPRASPAPLESVARVAGVSPQETSSVLVVLERAGLVDRCGRRWRIAEADERGPPR